VSFDAETLAQQLGQLGRDLSQEVIHLGLLEEDAVDCEGEYHRLDEEHKDREAQEFLHAEGTVDTRRNIARIKAIPARLLAQDAWLEWKRASARLRTQQANLNALHKRIEIGRSLLSREKALIGLTNSGVEALRRIMSEFDWLSFRLRDEFIDRYRGREPKWGFPISDNGDTLGSHAWLTKYSRRKPDGTRERFWEGLRRVIEGEFSIQKDYAERNRLPWDENQAHCSAEESYERAFAGKWSPPGRGLWAMGTELVNGRGDASPLYNCSFISTEGLEGMEDPSFPFCRLMDQSMLGVGVGFDTRGSSKITLHEPVGRFPYSVPDTREGWCESFGSLLRAFFLGTRLPVFDYSKIRPQGAPIKTFGGVAPGPEPLRKLHEKVTEILSGRVGEVLTSTDIVDLMNLAGKAVVSGNVRRSAEIALGDPSDDDFLELKNWEINPVRMGRDGWGHLSNNSVIAEVGGDYSHLAQRIALNGEPGIFWQDVAQNYGRLADPPDGKDFRVKGMNPCGEIPLESHGGCCLVEIFPYNCTDLQDFLRTIKAAFMYTKTVTLLMTRWPESNAVIARSRRIGVSVSGIAQFAEEYGWTELRRWMDAGYAEVRRWDRIYSDWLGVRESIRCTTVKPSGTVSLLHGATPGVHFPKERGFYIRTVREMKDSPFALVMERAGYPVEPSVSDPDSTVVISMPAEGPDVRSEAEVSIWEKANLAALAQRHWSDNAVSCTITFSGDEAKEIPAVLRALDGQLKSVSFLPMAENTYDQAPYQRVSRETWLAMRAKITPIDWDQLYGSPDLPEAEGESYCSTDVCEVR
jgi:ribonucleoside-triphosphate reductase (thioredoxin)